MSDNNTAVRTNIPHTKRKTVRKRISKHRKYGTSKLETYFAQEFLDKMGLKYIYEYEAKDIKRFYDFAIVATLPGQKVLYEDRHGVKSVKELGQYVRVLFIIEVDGDYYHANPDKVDPNDLSPMQKHNKRVDEYKDRWCAIRHIPLIRIWEDDIRKRPSEVRKTLKEVIDYIGAIEERRAEFSKPH